MNFFRSMMSEKGDVSSKRWIAVTIGAVVAFILVWVTVHYKEMTLSALYSAMLFILLLLGIATLPQILALINRKAPGTITEETALTVKKETTPLTENTSQP